MTSAQTFRDPYPTPTLVTVDEQAYDQNTLDELPDVTKVVDFDFGRHIWPHWLMKSRTTRRVLPSCATAGQRL